MVRDRGSEPGSEPPFTLDSVQWRLTQDPLKPGQKVSRKRAPAPLQVLGFSLDELKEARLAPVVDFKGRKPQSVGES